MNKIAVTVGQNSFSLKDAGQYEASWSLPYRHRVREKFGNPRRTSSQATLERTKRIPPERLPREIPHARPTRKRPPGGPRTRTGSELVKKWLMLLVEMEETVPMT